MIVKRQGQRWQLLPPAVPMAEERGDKEIPQPMEPAIRPAGEEGLKGKCARQGAQWTGRTVVGGVHY